MFIKVYMNNTTMVVWKTHVVYMKMYPYTNGEVSEDTTGFICLRCHKQHWLQVGTSKLTCAKPRVEGATAFLTHPSRNNGQENDARFPFN